MVDVASILTSIRGWFQSPKSIRDFNSMNMIDLIKYIQPEWSRLNMGRGANKFTNIEMINLNNAVSVYKQKGGDMGYFVNGSGSPGGCILS